MSTIKVAYNSNYGGFQLTKDMEKLLRDKLINAGREEDSSRVNPYWNKRHDPLLIETLEELGCKGTDIKIKEIPAVFKNSYSLSDYDGAETIRLNPEKVLKQYANLNLDDLTDQ